MPTTVEDTLAAAVDEEVPALHAGVSYMGRQLASTVLSKFALRESPSPSGKDGTSSKLTRVGVFRCPYFNISLNNEIMKRTKPSVVTNHRNHKPARAPSALGLRGAAELFKAMGDVERLRLLELLKHGERCVSEIVASVGDKFSTVSQRLRILRDEGLISRRREGQHLYYALAERHVADLIQNALAHAEELRSAPAHDH